MCNAPETAAGMIFMKRFITFVLLLCMVVSLAACGKETHKDIPDPDDSTHGSNPSGKQPTADPSDEKAEEYDLYLSEAMADNRRLYLNTDADWIEIGSHEEKVVSLNGYYLTDDKSKPHAFPLTGNVIEQNGFVVVLLPKDAPFHLSGEGETIYLIRNDEVADSLTYTEEIGDKSVSKDGVLPFATPGYANTQEGYEEYLSTVKLSELIFTEAMSDNSKYYPVNGNYYDFVELKNNSGHTINLGDYYLSDKRSKLTQYALPNRELGADEYVVIYCSGLEADGHAPFKISSSGEAIYLSDGVNLIDMIDVPGDLEKDKSYGRNDNRWVYMEVPSPGTKNNDGFEARVSIPVPDVKPGLYNSAITVTLSGEGTIYYTLDGTRPTERSAVYSQPITVSDVKTIRTFAVSGSRVSEIGEYTYLVGISHTLPVVSVSIPSSYLRGGEGILDNVSKTIEKECVLTLYEDGDVKFSVPCGFRLHGNDSRKGAKQNFQLRFRSEYGPGKLHYKLFENLDIDTFDSLLLKGGSEDYPYAVMRDEFCTGIVNGRTHLYVLECKPCVLYLGDQYWGIYYLRERFSDDYVADHFDVSAKSVDLLFSYGGVQSGSAKDYNSLLSYVRNHDLSNDEYCNYVTDRIDVLSLMDWYICRSYVGDKDVANIRYFRSTEYDSKWRWMYFDLDWAFWHTTDQPISGFIKNDDHNILMYNLLKNKNMRDTFLKRYAELLDSFMNEEFITAELDRYVAFMEPEMEKDRARWGYTVAGWKNAVKKMYDYVKDNARTKTVLKDIKSYFKLSDDQMKSYFGKWWTQ